MKKKKKQSNFSWSEPSAKEVVKALLNEFTAEERTILDGEDCAIPNMYSRILKEASAAKSTKYTLGVAKKEMRLFFFPEGKERVDVSNPEIQNGIYQFFSDMLEKPVSGIQGSKALELLAGVMEGEGMNKKQVISTYHLVKSSVKGKRTVHEKSTFEEEVRKVLNKFKDQFHIIGTENWHRELADEISELFCDAPGKKISAFISKNKGLVSIIAIQFITIILMSVFFYCLFGK